MPVKIGHSSRQRLLTNSGLASDEMPAAGWVEGLRVVGGKLLADIKGMPRKLAELVTAGAYPSRSGWKTKTIWRVED